MKMKILDFKTIQKLNITPEICLEWAQTIITEKYNSILPAKTSIQFNNDCFFNTMPSLIPDISRFGVKEVSRYPSRNPSLLADIMLYNSNDGELLAIMDGTWITSMRTGAIAALSVNLLKKKITKSYSFIGLGNVARATLLCLNTLLKHEPITVKVLKYKEQHIDFKNRFSTYKNISFEFYESASTLIRESDVVVSCVTVANTYFAYDQDYLTGILVVPVHTKGFQNCDLFFDKIYCDDISHIKDFKYFNQYKYCDEISNVFLKKCNGRISDEERILVYNIGISLHDIYFASKIYDMINDEQNSLSLQPSLTNKYWV
jgi:ornithine cyclodeaminase/alanine dehydrogenase-like protein (mu-crystallin family)